MRRLSAWLIPLGAVLLLAVLVFGRCDAMALAGVLGADAQDTCWDTYVTEWEPLLSHNREPLLLVRGPGVAAAMIHCDDGIDSVELRVVARSNASSLRVTVYGTTYGYGPAIDMQHVTTWGEPIGQVLLRALDQRVTIDGQGYPTIILRADGDERVAYWLGSLEREDEYHPVVRLVPTQEPVGTPVVLATPTRTPTPTPVACGQWRPTSSDVLTVWLAGLDSLGLYRDEPWDAMSDPILVHGMADAKLGAPLGEEYHLLGDGGTTLYCRAFALGIVVMRPQCDGWLVLGWDGEVRE